MSSQYDPAVFARTVSVANAKGGVGKTTCSCHLAALAALAGSRVLLIDLDLQGNCGLDLGYDPDGRPGLGDRGYSLVETVAARGHVPPLILRDVRPNLDVIPGGEQLEELVDDLMRRRHRDEAGAAHRLAVGLAPYVGEYGLVVVDTPPNHPVLHMAALVMSRYFIIPTKTDPASIGGLRDIANVYVRALAHNPRCTPLGVVLFGVDRRLSRVRVAVREQVSSLLGDDPPLFDTEISALESSARDFRLYGKLAHELEAMATSPVPGQPLARSTRSLAGEFQRLAEEALRRILAFESAEVPS